MSETPAAELKPSASTCVFYGVCTQARVGARRPWIPCASSNWRSQQVALPRARANAAQRARNTGAGTSALTSAMRSVLCLASSWAHTGSEPPQACRLGCSPAERTHASTHAHEREGRDSEGTARKRRTPVERPPASRRAWAASPFSSPASPPPRRPCSGFLFLRPSYLATSRADLGGPKKPFRALKPRGPASRPCEIAS
jgi:hypothetical protein